MARRVLLVALNLALHAVLAGARRPSGGWSALVQRRGFLNMACVRGGSSEVPEDEEFDDYLPQRAAAQSHSQRSYAAATPKQQRQVEEQEDEEVVYHDAVAQSGEEGEYGYGDASGAGYAAAVSEPADPAAAAVVERIAKQAAGRPSMQQQPRAVHTAGQQSAASSSATVQEKARAASKSSASGSKAKGTNGSADKKGQYNARMQWIITNKMRRILVDELRYLPDEVDAMMPDVAAVVINKHLERPRKGMPAEWRKDFHLRERGWRIRTFFKMVWNKMKEEKATLLVLGLSGLGAGVAGGLVKKYLWTGEEEEWEEVEVEVPWHEALRDAVVGRIEDIKTKFAKK